MKTGLSKSILFTCIEQFLSWLFPGWSLEKPAELKLIPIPVENKNYHINKMILFGVFFCFICLYTVSAKEFSNSFKSKFACDKQLKSSPKLLPVNEKFVSNLYAYTANGLSLADGNMILFDDFYSNAVDGYDARKMTNFGENFGITKNNVLLAIEKRQIIRADDSISYEMSGLKNIQYKIEIVATNLNHPGMVGFLLDNYSGTRTILNLNDTTNYSFSVTVAAGSSAKSRFKVVFIQPSFSTLPLTFILLNAQQNNGKIGLKWIVNNEENTQFYQIEKSYNGQLFTVISSVAADISKAHIYYWENTFTTNTITYFRIKSIDKNGSSYYSPTVTIAKKSLKKGISLFPNPVEGNELNLSFNNQPAGNYAVRLIGYSGLQFFKKTIIVSAGFQINNIEIPYDCYKGNYLLEIINPANERQLLPLVILRNN